MFFIATARATMRSTPCTPPLCKPGGQNLSNPDGAELSVTVEFFGSKKNAHIFTAWVISLPRKTTQFLKDPIVGPHVVLPAKRGK